MNTEFIIENLVPEDIKTVDGIDFHQKRYVKRWLYYKRY